MPDPIAPPPVDPEHQRRTLELHLEVGKRLAASAGFTGTFEAMQAAERVLAAEVDSAGRRASHRATPYPVRSGAG